MTGEDIVGLVAAVAVLGYLLVALLAPREARMTVALEAVQIVIVLVGIALGIGLLVWVYNDLHHDGRPR